MPAAYIEHPAEWREIVNATARATYDHPRVTADRLTRYVDLYVERWGRAPDLKGFRKQRRLSRERPGASGEGC